MIKAVFFDVDGTLVSYRRKFVSDRLLADLEALRARGVLTFVSTGRALQDLERTGMLREARFDGYVTINGQFCCGGDGAPYRDRPFRREELEAVYRVMRREPGVAALLEGNGESWLTRIDQRVREVFDFLHTELYPLCPLERMLEMKLYQFVPLVSREEARPLLEALPGCVCSRWHPMGLDILPGDGGKDAGLRATMERFGLRREEVMAFGDGDNDAPMLALAGLGVAMGNASQRAREAADHATGSVEEDGVSQALRRFGLLPE